MRRRTNWIARLAFGLLCIVAPLPAALALDPGKSLTQYVHSVWRTEDGLPQSAVTKILETSDGYLWVGTQGGIARFDGVRFTVFDHTNTPALHDDFVSDLAEDSHGTLWIATANGGVTSFRNGVFSHLDSVGPRAGISLAATPDGSVWIGGHGGLVHVRDGRVVRIYTASDGLWTDLIRRLASDKEGSVWIATSGGLNRMADGRLVAYPTEGDAAARDVTDLFLDLDDELWTRTRDTKIAQRSADGARPWNIDGFPFGTVSDTLMDRDRNLWFASTGEGLLRVNGQKVDRFTSKQGLSSDQVNTLYEDRNGNLWVGTLGGGLDRFQEGAFTTYATEEGLAADPVQSVMQDSKGDVWATTGAGLSRIRDNKVRTFTVADGLPSNEMISLLEDHAQNLWVGTGDGLVRIRNERVMETVAGPQGIPRYQITGIYEDDRHRLWLATRGGGVVRYAAGEVRSYTKADGLLDDFVFSLIGGPRGTVWAGTRYGLDTIQDGRIGSVAKNALNDVLILSLYYDAQKILWIGTNGHGLFRRRNGVLERFTTHQGLADDTINNILEDASGNLWIGSNKGVMRIERPDLDAVSAGTKPSLTPLLFGKADGMKSSETTAGSQPAGWRGRDGRLWFPTIRGVSVIDPTRLSLSTLKPQARIEQVFADEIPVARGASVKLRPGTSRLEIHFTAPNLSAPQRTRFRYKLDGLDAQWISGNMERMAQYTNLSPGRYVFRVGASGADGSWNQQEDVLHFYISPRFFQTWWFRLLSALLVLAFAWMAYRMRVNWLYAKAGILEERQRIAGEIHDSLAQGLSGIVFQTEAALISMSRAPHMTSTHLTSARDLAKTSLDDARYSVWNLSPPNLIHKSLVESLSAMAHQLTAGRVDKLEIRTTGTPWSLRSEARHHVVLITQEAISNAIQHGNARTISIDVTYASDALLLVVSDDGTGFSQTPDIPQVARGYGMNNIRRRADRLGARLEVTSEIGRGARVSLRVPRPNLLGRLWRYLRGNDTERIEG
ncbi:MAG: two-component regulator propeller domain-containing protein [Pseudoxanthomonas sp.]